MITQKDMMVERENDIIMMTYATNVLVMSARMPSAALAMDLPRGTRKRGGGRGGKGVGEMKGRETVGCDEFSIFCLGLPNRTMQGQSGP